LGRRSNRQQSLATTTHCAKKETPAHFYTITKTLQRRDNQPSAFISLSSFAFHDTNNNLK
jgi:hypothetical protein